MGKGPATALGTHIDRRSSIGCCLNVTLPWLYGPEIERATEDEAAHETAVP